MSDHLPRRTKFAYGLGDLGFSLTSTILGAYFAIFLTDVVGIPAGTAAAAIFLGRTWDYINDPIIGHISDRTRTRWGRRRPFFLFGALPLALTFTMMWWRPPWDGTLALAVYYALAYVLYDTAATFGYMPFVALAPDLTSNYDERTSLMSYRVLFSVVGSLIAFTIPLLLVGAFRPENASKILSMGAAFGLVSALPLVVTFFGTRERREYVDRPVPSLRESLRATRSNRPFLFSLWMYLMTWLPVEIVQATLLFFVVHVARREAQSDLLMATIFVVAIIALPLWQWASNWRGKRWAYIAGIAFWAVVQIVLITVTPATALVPLLILCVLAGVGVSAAHLLPWAILPDAVEWDEWQTGERHEGMFFSLTSLAQKVASSIAVPLTLLVLEITGYVPNAAEQPAGALLGIRIAIGPIPAVLLCVGIAVAFFYPLGRDQHRQIVRELERRRAGRNEVAG